MAEETGSSLAFSETPEDRFSHDEAHIMVVIITREANFAAVAAKIVSLVVMDRYYVQALHLFS